MRIKRKFQGFIPAGKILDLPSKSKADTYSCNQINDMTEHETVLFDGILTSHSSINLDMTPYKRLLITFVTYNGNDINTGGASNIIMLDLSNTNGLSKYIAGVLVPYLVNHQMQGQMWCSCEVDAAKTTLTTYVGFGADAIGGSDMYSVRRIVGVK